MKLGLLITLPFDRDIILDYPDWSNVITKSLNVEEEIKRESER